MPDDQAAVATAAPAAASRQGFTAEGLKAFNDQFHRLVDEKKLANVVTLIARHGEIVNLDAYGVLDVSADPPVPCQTDSIFRIASMTKPITGAAMMMLWEEGKWALDDPVAKHIPEFEGLKVRRKDGDPIAQASPMTMAQLMSHSAGFGRAGEYEGVNLREGDLQDMIDKLAKQPLSFQPGKDWRYGPSVDIQGYLIEKLSGQGLDEFFEQRLFAPLGMTDTGFWVDPAKGHRVSRIHKYDDDGVIRAAGPGNLFNTVKPKFLAGGGGLVSKIEDYWRFAQMILNGGEFAGRRYLKQSTVDLMHANVLEPGVNVTLYSPDTTGLGFGMDFAIVQDPAAAKTSQGIESFYWGGAFGTWFWIDPVNEMIVIGMIQNVAGSQTAAGNPAVREQSAQAVYAAMTDRRP
jgi:CubicO group peptidase (beta-lactamase class C family)